MGIKTNSPAFRLGIFDNNWQSKYSESTPKDYNLYVHHDNEIRKFLARFFTMNGLLLHHYKIEYTNKTLYIFVSYYITSKVVKHIKEINQSQKLRIELPKIQTLPRIKTTTRISKKNLLNNKPDKIKVLLYFLKKKFNLLKTRLHYLRRIKLNIFRTRILKQYKKLFIEKNSNNNFVDSFSQKFLESFSIFTKNKINIICTTQNLNKGLSLRLKKKESKQFRQVLLKLRRFKSNNFFKDAVNIIMIALLKKNSAKLVSEFIAHQLSFLKRPNFFLNFLKNLIRILKQALLFKIRGIKIVIKGRITGRPRKKVKRISIGDIPLQSINSKINYSESTAYTANGTFGIRVWICEKKYLNVSST